MEKALGPRSNTKKEQSSVPMSDSHDITEEWGGGRRNTACLVSQLDFRLVPSIVIPEAALANIVNPGLRRHGVTQAGGGRTGKPW